MSEPRKPRKPRRILPEEEVKTTEGRAAIRKRRERKLVVSDSYRPFAASKAVKLISDASHQFKKGKESVSRYEQTIRASTIKARFKDVGLDTSTLQGSIVNELIEKIIQSTPKTEEIIRQTESLGEMPIRVQNIVDSIEILAKRNKISDETYFKVRSALRDVSSSPPTVSSHVLKSEQFARARQEKDSNLRYPTGESIREEQAALVTEYLNTQPTPIDDVLKEYAFLMSRKIPYQAAAHRMSRKMRGFDFSQKRIDYRAEPPVGTARTETEQLKAGTRILAAIDLYHTHKKIPVVIEDLLKRVLVSNRLTPSQMQEARARLLKVQVKHTQDVADKKAGKAKIYEMYRSDSQIVPAEMVREEFIDWKNTDTSFGKSKLAEVLAILSEETGVLMSQIHRQYPIRGPSSLENNIPWFIFGEGVHRVLKPMKKLTGEKALLAIEAEEKRELHKKIDEHAKILEDEFEKLIIGKTFEVNEKTLRKKTVTEALETYETSQKELIELNLESLNARMALDGIHLKTREKRVKEERKKRETQFILDVKAKREEFETNLKELIRRRKSKEQERKIRVDAPLQRFVDAETKIMLSKVKARQEEAEFREVSEARMKKLKEEDLEKNYVELTRQRARSRAKLLQDAGEIKWRGVRKVRFRTAMPFIVNSYMSEARKEQLKILDSAIKALGSPKDEEEEKLLRNMKWKRKMFAKVQTYVDKKSELDRIWRNYEQVVYAPKTFKSDLVKLQKLVKDENDKSKIKRLTEWVSLVPTDKITPNDLVLPKIDLREKPARPTDRVGTIEKVLKTGEAMDYRIARTRLYDELKEFRESEDKSVSDLAADISRRLVEADSPIGMGGKRGKIDNDLSKMRRKYLRKVDEAKPLDPNNPAALAKILRLRYEDEYISPRYAMDAFGILSLMESGMLNIGKKPSDFVEEYLAAGRMLDPASTFPEVARSQSIKSYSVMPTMSAIKFELENVHAHPTIRDWAKTQNLNELYELSISGMLDPFLEAAILQKTEVEDVQDVYERYQSSFLIAKEKMKDIGKAIVRRITKGVHKDEYEIRKVYKLVEEKQMDGSIRIMSPALEALNISPKKRTKEQHTIIKLINNALLDEGYKKAHLDEAQKEITFVLTFMILDESEFVKTYHDYRRFVERRDKLAPAKEALAMREIDLKIVFPEIGAYVDMARGIVSERFPDEEIRDNELLERLAEIRKDIITMPKDELTEEDALLSNKIKQIFRNLEEKKFELALKKAFMHPATAQALSSLTELRRDMVELWEREMKRVTREKKRLSTKLRKDIKAGAIAEDEARDLLDAIVPAFRLSDLVGGKADEDAAFEILAGANAGLGHSFTRIKFLELVKKRKPVLFKQNKLMTWFKEDLQKRTKKKTEHEDIVSLAEKSGFREPELAQKPVDIYLRICDEITMNIDDREVVLRELSARAGVEFKDTSIRIKPIRDKCDPAIIEHMQTIKTGETIMSFLGTPHQLAHKRASRKTAEMFFGIDELLEKYDISSY